MSLAEVMIVVALVGVSVAAASIYVKPVEQPLRTAGNLTEGFFRQARLQAIANTSAYRVIPSSTNRLDAQYANNCSAETWTTAPGVNVVFPDEVVLDDVDWTVCFNGKGISDNNLVVVLSHPTYGTHNIEVLLGGTTRILDEYVAPAEEEYPVEEPPAEELPGEEPPGEEPPGEELPGEEPPAEEPPAEETPVVQNGKALGRAKHVH